MHACILPSDPHTYTQVIGDEFDQWVLTTLNVSCVPGGLEALQQSGARGQPRAPAAPHVALTLGWAVALGARALGRRRRRKQ